MRQANLKVILEVTGIQCNSDRRALASSCERLGKTMQAAEVCTRCNFTLVEPRIRVSIVNTYVDKVSSYRLSYVVYECLPDMT